jgi:hypothetical protein
VSDVAYLQALERLSMPDVPKRLSRWRHLKSGKPVIVMGVCLLEKDCGPAVAYREFASPDAPWWVRPLDEFLDGRFEKVDGFFEGIQHGGRV